MTETTHYVGLDVHKDSISIAVAKSGRDPAEPMGAIPNDGVKLLKRLDRLGPRDRLLCCYEAGPSGYGLHRYLRSAGVQCDVVAPSLVPDRQGDRVKTDQRDAVKLAHYLRSGDLTSVWVPDERTEALRDLVRARDDAKIAEISARHRLSKFFLRHERRYPGKTAWTVVHFEWIRSQKFAHVAQDRVLREYLHAVEYGRDAVARLTDDISELVETSTLEPLVKGLQALKGVRLINCRRNRRRARRSAALSHCPRSHGLRRTRCSRGLHRKEPQAILDRQDRKQACATAARRGGVGVPSSAANRRSPQKGAAPTFPRSCAEPLGLPRTACIGDTDASSHSASLTRSS